MLFVIPSKRYLFNRSVSRTGNDIIANIYDKHLLRVGNPRFYHHPYQSPQLELWETGEVSWFVIIRTDPPVRRRKRKGRLLVVQLPMLPDGTQR